MLAYLLRMSDKADSKKPRDKVGFECAPEVAALLNCVTTKNYNELKCIPLLKKLRACTEKKVSNCSWLSSFRSDASSPALPCPKFARPHLVSAHPFSQRLDERMRLRKSLTAFAERGGLYGGTAQL